MNETATPSHWHRYRRHVHRRGRLDEVTGVLTVTKTPSTPADPAEGFLTGLTKILGLLAADPAEIASISHGTTIATNQLLAGDVGELGFITSEGYEFMLEIARQSVPDGYGNSYFWVKPDRIVPPDRVKTVARAPGPHRRRAAPVRRGTGDRRRPLVPRPRHRHARRVPPALLCQSRARGADGRGSWRVSIRLPWSRCRRRCCPNTGSTSGR